MFAAALMLATAAAPAPEGAEPEPAFVLVAQALEAVAGLREGKSDPRFPGHVELWENGAGQTTAARFGGYARECPLDRIERFKLAQPPEGETLISVTWACADRDVVNEALFSVAAGTIKRISFRPIPIVRLR